MAKVIVTGGAGYIGSHTVVDLLEQGHQVVCIDNFFNSHRSMWQHLETLVNQQVPQYDVDLTNTAEVNDIFSQHSDADAVIHFAARIYVGESVAKPTTYFRTNLNSLLNVLDAMTQHQQRAIIFSSSCSVYGNAQELPVTEETPFGEAESPYARTKQMGEHIIHDFVRAQPHIHGTILRYFNPAGAHPSGQIGEAPKLEQSHLVPVIMEVGAGHRDKLKVFGGNYPTRDGSCLRDYIHVCDLARAHTMAVEAALTPPIIISKADASVGERAGKAPETNPSIYNLGSGAGVTVLEAIKAFESATNTDLAYEVVAARDGDVAAIYSTTEKANSQLGWQPRYSLEDIMRTAWAWEQARPTKIAS